MNQRFLSQASTLRGHLPAESRLAAEEGADLYEWLGSGRREGKEMVIT